MTDGESRRDGIAGPARWAADQPTCALCAGPGTGQVAVHHLTHGISVVLCEGHRADGFQRRDGGREFVLQLAGLWTASGRLTATHRAALATHLRRIARNVAARHPRPGSYSWPHLRAEAERRFAAGEPPRKVIHELRTRHTGGDAIVPSLRTMRRWFTDARWLAAPDLRDGHSQPQRATAPSKPSRIASLAEIPGLARSLAEPYWWAFAGWPRGSPYRERSGRRSRLGAGATRESA